MLQEKKSAQAKTARRDIATLLEQGKLEKAKVKVENSASASISARACCAFLKIALRADIDAVINEDVYVELLELLELYCELLIARFGLLDQK